MVWATEKCTASLPPESVVEGGEPFIIERMIYRWPSVVCHEPTKASNSALCTGINGDRRMIVNPRKVTPHFYCRAHGAWFDVLKQFGFRAWCGGFLFVGLMYIGWGLAWGVFCCVCYVLMHFGWGWVAGG